MQSLSMAVDLAFKVHLLSQGLHLQDFDGLVIDRLCVGDGHHI